MQGSLNHWLQSAALNYSPEVPSENYANASVEQWLLGVLWTELYSIKIPHLKS